MNAKWICYLIVLLSVALLSLIRWKSLQKGEKIVGALVILTLISESTALFANHRWNNNMPVYHFFNPLEFFLVSLYFNCSIDYFHKKNLGLVAGIAGLIVGILNTLFLEKITTFNSNFLLFEGTTIIIYCLLALHQVLLDEEHLPYRFAYFWITICCLIFWSGTFTGFGLYALVQKGDRTILLLFDKIMAVANFVFYIGIGAVLFFRKKLIHKTCA